MDKLVELSFTGAIGYRLLDLHTDSNFIGKEAVFLGNYLISTFEEGLLEIFDSRETMRVFNKHVKLFTEVEYLEKHNIWKPCPFNWNNAKILGQKASPLFSIFEIILLLSKVDRKQADELIEGLTYVTASIQMIDDLSDSAEDLSNGIETLAMSDFYGQYGIDVKDVKESIKKFLTKERLLKIYDTTQQLFQEAREIFTKYDDDMLLLFVEIQNFKLNVLYETLDEDE
jgi:predicted nucleic acid-binding protein